MLESELKDLIARIQERQCEEQVVEVKSAHQGCTEKLYDTYSAFANQNVGGTLVFGLDERQNFKKLGVYNAQDLQKKLMEYGEQMTPVVRPVLTVYAEGDMVFVSAEIPPVDIAERPCFKTAKGRMQGSYIRVGDADKPMTEYEVYSYEAFRKKYRDDIRTVQEATLMDLNQKKLEDYIRQRVEGRPNLATIPKERLYHLAGILQKEHVTLAALLLFGIYPQAYFPQLSVIATAVPGTEMGLLDDQGRRFTDSKRIEGTLPEMLEGSLRFVRSNMRTSTTISPVTGQRVDVPQYPIDAIREAILNALVHRDYSFHTEGMPIQLTMFSDRIEIANPGGLYGRLTVDQLGKVQPDTRNPVLVTAMEAMKETENRYSGIPRIRHAMEEMGLPEPEFADQRGTFKVCLRSSNQMAEKNEEENAGKKKDRIKDPKKLLQFCMEPKNRQEIIEHIGVKSGQYALRKYLDPLVEQGMIRMTIPNKPKSADQRYITVQ